VILTVRFIFIALGDVLAPFVQKWFSTVKQIFLLNIMSNIILMVFVIFWHQYALLIFGLAFMVMAVAEILIVNAIQNEIKEEGRSTVMSFYGVGQNVVMICFSLIYALLAGIFTLQQVYLFIAIFGIAGGCAFYFFVKVKR
jgi:MFS family permease